MPHSRGHRLRRCMHQVLVQAVGAEAEEGHSRHLEEVSHQKSPHVLSRGPWVAM